MGYNASRLWLNKFLSRSEKWNKEEISKRFDLIGERFLKIWGIPNITLTEDTDNDEVNIFEAEEPRFKKLEYAIFFDQKLDIKDVAKLYVEIFKQLFELQPEIFFTSEIGQRIGLTKNPTEGKTRQPIAINDTYYIESNLDSINKFDRIKQALTLLNLEDELIIKYAKENSEPHAL